ncbi:hypothetical protein BG844_17415 [Couchioplanes caeruleus subsp. caeruleus]|uniref:SURF1-like protein n=2 Tax=Couchioplanes caeruleus TaxID=56438 RepID=A0A1K0GUJ3_9ACTN|nr:hypothetical protein BG844_17415 [Couchioplanes caeruleus subsp. caeruleus]
MVAVPVLCLAAFGGVVTLIPQAGPPAAADAAATAAALERAARAQGVCYGWRLLPHREPRKQSEAISVGSSAGAGVSVRTAPGCSRWLELIAELNTGARHHKVLLRLVDWRTDEHRVRGGPPPDGLRIGAVGLTDEIFLDDTGAGILRAVRALPLIAAEKGIAEPISAESVPPAALRPLPPVGNDVWRSHRQVLVPALLLFGLATVSAVVAVRDFRRRRR